MSYVVIVGGGVSLFYDWFPVYAFHLGLFVFCSGYFYKEKYETAPMKYIWRKIKTLIIPLYIYNFVYAGIITLLSRFGFHFGDVNIYSLLIKPINDGHQFSLNFSSWFVIPLFMVEALNIIFRKSLFFMKQKNKERVLFALYFLMGMIGSYLASAGYRTGWWIVLDRMLYFMPFYGLGNYYKSELEKYDSIGNTFYFLSIFTVQLAIICIYKETPAYSPSWMGDFDDGVFLPYMVGVLGIAFWLRISNILEPVIGKSKAINVIADNTYSIMVNHPSGFLVVNTLYALIFKYTSFLNDFSIKDYKENVTYTYMINGMGQSLIIYLIAGLVFPITLSLLIHKIKNKIRDINARS